MEKWERKCKEYCRKLVMKSFCERCGNSIASSWLQQHHGLFKSSQRYKINPFYRYDPTIQFCLCMDCHLHRKEAPHVNQDKFEQAMGTINRDKIQRLRAVNIGPLSPAIDDRIIDWHQVYVNLIKFGRPLGNEIFSGC